MTKYPNGACEAHFDVTTSEPVCIICIENEIARLESELEAARVDAERLLSVLVNVYSTLESANVDGIITDTIWMPVHVSKSETLFDYIDAAIDAARGGK